MGRSRSFWRPIGLVLLAAGVAPAAAHATPRADVPLRPIVTNYDRHDPTSSGRLTVAGIRSLITSRGIRDVDALLAALGESHARLMTSFVMMYSSRSLHGADVTPRHPRVIFHRDGLFAAVTGDPSKPSYETLELIEFDSRERVFNFHLAEFPGKQGTGAVRFKTNPAECRDCHGQKLRPIWGAYPLWEGAFGGDGGTLSATEQRHLTSLVARLGDASMSRYRRFLREESDVKENAPLNLGVHLAWLNFNRVHTELSRSAFYRPYRFAMFGAGMGCEKIETFLPERLRQAHEAKLRMTRSDLLDDTRRAMLRTAALAVRRYNVLQTLAPHAVEVEDKAFFDVQRASRVASFRYLVEGQTVDPELHMRNWTISFTPGRSSYSFSTGVFGISDFFQREIRPMLLAERSDFERYPVDGVPFLIEKECEEIAAISRNVLSESFRD